MLRWRLISATIIIPTILLLIGLDYYLGTANSIGRPGLVIALMAVSVALMAASEVLAFDVEGNQNVKNWAVYLGTLIIVGMSCVPLLYENYPADCSVGRLGWPLFGMAAAVGLAFVSQMIGYRQGDQVMDAVARTLLVVAYIGLLMSFWIPIRTYFSNAWGLVALTSLYIPVKMSDTLAYTVGKMFGKNKLSPHLSPGKTVEGAAGAILGGCLGSLFVFYILAPWLTGQQTQASIGLVLIFGLVVTLVGIVGDLSESLLKRDGGVKNSSRWLPGLGGVMDIVDSVLATAPIVYAFWLTGWFDPVLGA